jgi:hypothetical protein
MLSRSSLCPTNRSGSFTISAISPAAANVYGTTVVSVASSSWVLLQTGVNVERLHPSSGCRAPRLGRWHCVVGRRERE